LEQVRPLHVRVAEALGWVDMRPRSEDGLWGGQAPDVSWPWTSPPRYDTDWSATGPLIEKYGIRVELTGPVVIHPIGKWRADYGFGEHDGFGATPLLAVCNLILALKDAGKL
jgi:hypothetical protein